MKINVLIVEDNPDELFLILRELKKSEFEVNHLLVDCAQDLINALEKGPWDVILSDFNIPGFGGAEALKICSLKNGHIPFIIVSGTVGEETAVSLIKAGAKDYVMKNNLPRLSEAIKREIKDAEILRERNLLIEKSNKLSMIVESSPDIVFNFDGEQNITYFNKAANEQLQLHSFNVDKLSLKPLFSQYWTAFFQATVLPELAKFGKWEGELYFKKYDLSEVPVIASIVQYQTGANEFSLIAIDITERKANEKALIEFNASLEETIKLRTAELLKSNVDLVLKNKEVTDSIKYAKHLQNAILPSNDFIKKLFPHSFVFYKPKDIVSGDFYWFEEWGNKKMFAAVDCTGHGVPGAFMSIVGNNLLNQVINVFGLTQPNLILNELNKGITKRLNQTRDGASVKDGMDIALCAYDHTTGVLEFSGAYTSLWLIRDGKIEVIKGDKQPIGLFIGEELKSFTNKQIITQKGDTVYLFTDGYADQFGGPKEKKFKYKQLQEIILSNRHKTMDEQQDALQNAVEAWQGKLDQIDDILVMGIRL